MVVGKSRVEWSGGGKNRVAHRATICSETHEIRASRIGLRSRVALAAVPS